MGGQGGLAEKGHFSKDLQVGRERSGYLGKYSSRGNSKCKGLRGGWGVGGAVTSSRKPSVAEQGGHRGGRGGEAVNAAMRTLALPLSETGAPPGAGAEKSHDLTVILTGLLGLLGENEPRAQAEAARRWWPPSEQVAAVGGSRHGRLLSWKSWSVVERRGQAMGADCCPGPELPGPLPGAPPLPWAPHPT